MEWIKRMNLKKSLFILTLASILIAALLSVLFFWICMELNIIHPPNGVMLHVNESYIIEPDSFSGETKQTYPSGLLSLLQIILPVLFFVSALLLAVFLFYRWKLKEPLIILQDATARIMKNDLDFSVAPVSSDELGALCTAFETMRTALLANNQTLWRQTEEQKRLNAAFSHDLRNPLTVLKGSAKMAMRCAPAEGELLAHLTRIEVYTGRLERYVEIMSSTGRLDQVPLEPAFAEPVPLCDELESAIRLLTAGSGKQLSFHGIACPAHSEDPFLAMDVYHGTKSPSGTAHTIYVDKNALFQITENLVTNALRFAAEHVTVSLSLIGENLILEVTDDGRGFPDKLLKNGIRPFQKGVEDAAHFGMGLYICKLLCEKHGGCIEIGNKPSKGAYVRAILSVF